MILQRGGHAQRRSVIGQFAHRVHKYREVLFKLFGSVYAVRVLTRAGVVTHFLYAQEMCHIHVHADAIQLALALVGGGLNHARVEREGAKRHADLFGMVAHTLYIVIIDSTIFLEQRQAERNKFQMRAIMLFSPVDYVKQRHFFRTQSFIQRIATNTQFHSDTSS